MVDLPIHFPVGSPILDWKWIYHGDMDWNPPSSVPSLEAGRVPGKQQHGAWTAAHGAAWCWCVQSNTPCRWGSHPIPSGVCPWGPSNRDEDWHFLVPVESQNQARNTYKIVVPQFVNAKLVQISPISLWLKGDMEVS